MVSNAEDPTDGQRTGTGAQGSAGSGADVGAEAGADVGAEAGADVGAQPGKPAKPHGDPLFAEAEGANGPVDVPETGKGTATSATA